MGADGPVSSPFTLLVLIAHLGGWVGDISCKALHDGYSTTLIARLALGCTEQKRCDETKTRAAES